MKMNIFKKAVSIICVGSLALLTVSFSAASSPKLNKTNKKIRAGKTFTLKVKNTDKKVKWSVNNKKVLKITHKGNYSATFKARKKGKAAITAKAGGKKLKCKVTVTKKKAKKSKTKKQPQGAGVYITNSGKKYHRSGCRFLSKSKIPTSLSWAKANGYTACKVCGG